MLHLSFEKSRSDYTLLTVDAIYGQTRATLLSESRRGRYIISRLSSLGLIMCRPMRDLSGL